ncbi:uncharacterized protein [Ambystoma mexicanum]|uniref:uncharacterized protein n=1 Tax=Ambystoma mexicanum TaxID=8296 RepID=UPI0037E7050F
MPVSHMVSEVGCNSNETSCRIPKYEKLNVRASNPTVAVGFDLCSSQTETIPPKERHLIPTDLVLIPPPETYIRLAPKSGLAWRFGIDVLAGVIVPDFRGDVKLLLHNHGEEASQIQAGDQIAHVILESMMLPMPREETETDVPERGDFVFWEADA